MKPRFLLLIFISFFPLSALAELTDFYLEVNPKDGAISDSYELSVVLEGPSADGSAQPHLQGGDFKATFVGPRTETMIVNGDVTRRMIFVYQLTPTKVGAITTPSATIEVEGSEYVANAITVNVSRTPAKVSGVHFEQFVDNREPYVGEQIVYSIEVATNASLYELRLDDSPFEGFWGEPFKDETRTSRQINGSRYAVSGTKRSLYAMRPGKLPLPERTLRAKMRERSAAQSPFGPFNPFDDGFLNPLGSRMVDKTFVADATEVVAKPLPPPPTGMDKEALKFGLVGATELTSSLSSKKTNVGEPITFEINLKSFGNLRPVQIDLPVPPELKVYPEKPRVSLDLVDGRHLMSKAFGFSIVPKKPGTYTIPRLTIGYFDPQKAQYALLNTEPVTFDVAGTEIPQESIQTDLNSREVSREAGTKEAPATAESKLENSSAEEASGFSLVWVSIAALLGLLIGWSLRGGTRPHNISIEVAKDLKELDEALVAEMNKKLGLNPPANKWGLRAAIMRRFSDRREVAADIIGLLDLLDNAMYGKQEVSVAEIKNKAKAALKPLSNVKAEVFESSVN